jgi:hypothetical protein
MTKPTPETLTYNMRAGISIQKWDKVTDAYLDATRTLAFQGGWLFALRAYRLVNDSLEISAMNVHTDEKRTITVPAQAIWKDVQNDDFEGVRRTLHEAMVKGTANENGQSVLVVPPRGGRVACHDGVARKHEAKA